MSKIRDVLRRMGHRSPEEIESDDMAETAPKVLNLLGLCPRCGSDTVTWPKGGEVCGAEDCEWNSET